ncbi:MAG TPA: UDP-glucose/GDP-mannose dehydrogenase family protein [Steroidobacteraceae bacterium]|nr:UDP-glucose/GDP-mannose dehydrogenase family protein [Steroidobacteraceae bacterium]
MLTTETGAPEQGIEDDADTGAAPFSGDRKRCSPRRISIFGLGYVGAVSLACLARDGHRVIGVDIDPVKLDLIRNRKSPILEEGIQELMRDVVNSGRVSVTDDAMQAMQESEVSFVCVGTPSASNGSQDLTAILRLAEQIGAALKLKQEFHTIVIRSTVQPGTVEEKIEPILERVSGRKSGVDFGLCFQPEFLREGSSIRDYDHPPYTIVGGNCEAAVNAVREVFQHLDARFLVTHIRVAETLKMACNAFHALKITFANEIGRVSQSLGIDPHEVMRLVCADKRLNISPAYLKPGFAFGGSCLPKDLRALTNIAKQNDIVLPMLSSLLASNRVHIDHAVDKILKLGRPKVGMLGLSFKTGTDDLRESPLVLVAKRLLGEGCELRIFDPEVQLSRLLGANRSYIDANIPHIGELLCADIESMIDPSEVILVGLQQSALNDALQARVRPEQYLVDLVNLPNRDLLRCRYEGVCW